MALSPAQAAAWLREYDGFGLRRAGTAGDHACARWLAEQLRAAGLTARLARVPIEVRSVDEASIEFETSRIDGLPLFDAPDTPHAGIEAALAAMGPIEIEPGAASIKGQTLEQQRRASTQPALVIATRGAGDSLAPINAQYFNAPFGPPALQVAGQHFKALAEAAQRNVDAHVIIRTHRVAGESFNIVGGNGESPRLVLLSPRTSWWESTAERAGGLLAWREAQCHAATHGIAVRAFATCGHELGHLGLEQVLHDEPGLLKAAPLWIHLGANLGCASDPRLTVRASDPHDATRLRALLIEHGYPVNSIIVEPIERALGEARDLADHGARVLSLIGNNAHFHAPSDRFPGNVSAQWVAAIARSVCAWIA